MILKPVNQLCNGSIPGTSSADSGMWSYKTFVCVIACEKCKKEKQWTLPDEIHHGAMVQLASNHGWSIAMYDINEPDDIMILCPECTQKEETNVETIT